MFCKNTNDLVSSQYGEDKDFFITNFHKNDIEIYQIAIKYNKMEENIYILNEAKYKEDGVEKILKNHYSLYAKDKRVKYQNILKTILKNKALYRKEQDKKEEREKLKQIELEERIAQSLLEETTSNKSDEELEKEKFEEWKWRQHNLVRVEMDIFGNILSVT
jgi:hypothetical protein